MLTAASNNPSIFDASCFQCLIGAHHIVESVLILRAHNVEHSVISNITQIDKAVIDKSAHGTKCTEQAGIF